MTKIKRSEVKKISDTNNKKTVTLDSFQGIDTRSDHKNSKGCGELVNFRIRHDGSLEKREGYRHLAELGGNIRAVWMGKINGESCCYALADSAVLRLNEDGSFTQAATTETSEGDADFFFYRNRLYLADGNKLLYLTNEGLAAPVGYVPLVAKNWSGGEIGQVNEPRNLLCDRARFHYIMGEDVTPILYVNEALASVDAILVNGVQISEDRYKLLSSKMVITVTGLASYDSVVLYVTYADADVRLPELLANTRASVFGGANNSRPFLWGNPDRPNVIYGAGYVSENELIEAQRVYADSDELYFPAGCEFSVGDGQYTVRAVSRHYDRMLIFTEGGTWMANDPDCGTAEFPVININSSVGVLSYGAAAEMENQPCTVGERGIYRWNSDTDELNDCNAYSISLPIDSRLSRDFFESASVFANTAKRELMFTYPNDTGAVWVYSASSQAWSRFEGVFADKIFDFYGHTAFIRGGNVYLFDENAGDDCGAEIKAYFESNLLDFDTDRKKQLMGIELSYEGGEITAEVFSDGGTTPSVSAAFGGGRHQRVFRRLSAGRFGDIRVRLTAGGADRQVVHSLSIKTR